MLLDSKFLYDNDKAISYIHQLPSKGNGGQGGTSVQPAGDGWL